MQIAWQEHRFEEVFMPGGKDRGAGWASTFLLRAAPQRAKCLPLGPVTITPNVTTPGTELFYMGFWGTPIRVIAVSLMPPDLGIPRSPTVGLPSDSWIHIFLPPEVLAKGRQNWAVYF